MLPVKSSLTSTGIDRAVTICTGSASSAATTPGARAAARLRQVISRPVGWDMDAPTQVRRAAPASRRADLNGEGRTCQAAAGMTQRSEFTCRLGSQAGSRPAAGRIAVGSRATGWDGWRRRRKGKPVGVHRRGGIGGSTREEEGAAAGVYGPLREEEESPVSMWGRGPEFEIGGSTREEEGAVAGVYGPLREEEESPVSMWGPWPRIRNWRQHQGGGRCCRRSLRAPQGGGRGPRIHVGPWPRIP